MDWTIGPLDYFLDHFLDLFSFFFLAPFLDRFNQGEADRLYLGEGWDAIYQ